ncbi:hypothetical protein D3C87_1929570 [compost metagenome]
MDLVGVGNQRQVAVVTAIEASRWITAHDALQQHPTRHLQAPAFEKTLDRHHLATGHAIKVGGDALDLLDTL